MAMKKIKAIVLNSVDKGEADKFVTLMSFEEGKIYAVAKSVKKAKAKLKFATEPFCFGNFELTEGSGVPIITGCELIELFYELRENIEKLYIASAIAELMDRYSGEALLVKEEFVYFIRALIRIVDYKEQNYKVLLIKILHETINLSGFGLNSLHCGECGADMTTSVHFDWKERNFLCKNCGKSEEIFPIRAFKYLQLIEKTVDDKLHSIKVPRDDIDLLLGFLEKYIEVKFGFSNKSLIAYTKML